MPSVISKEDHVLAYGRFLLIVIYKYRVLRLFTFE